MRKEEGATVDFLLSAILFSLPSQLSRQYGGLFVGQDGLNRDISKPSGKPHKIPEKSNERVALTVTAISSLQMIDKNILSYERISSKQMNKYM